MTIWERQTGEPARWFDRFQRYRMMGVSRSLMAVIRDEAAMSGREKPKNVPGSWRDASVKWRWVQRCEAWDAYQRQEDEKRWETRRQELRDAEWDIAEELMAKARQMLAMPILKSTRTTSEDGKQVITNVEPARWGFADVAKYVETADKLKRLAAGMETERVNWRQEANSAGLNPDEVFQHVLDAIATYVAESARADDSGGDTGGQEDFEDFE